MTVLLAFFRIMNDTELKERYAQEPWGKLLIEMGMEPYDTESSARRVAEYVAGQIAALRSERDAAVGAINDCVNWSNGRESEWGDRAENAFDFLHRFLANVQTEGPAA